MYEIYAQVMVEFTFQILSKPVNVLFYLLYFEYLLTTETVLCFPWFSGSRQAYFFHFTSYKRKQIIVTSDEMQDPNWISGLAWQTLCLSPLLSQSFSGLSLRHLFIQHTGWDIFSVPLVLRSAFAPLLHPVQLMYSLAIVTSTVVSPMMI